MKFRDAVKARLTGDAVIRRAAGMIDWTLILTALPAITLQIVADSRPQHQKGFWKVRPTTVQVDVWAEDAATAEDLRDLCIELLVQSATLDNVQFQRATIDRVTGGAEREQPGAPQRQRGQMFRYSFDITFNHNAN